MPLIRRCCCTRNLRRGSIVATSWTLIWCIMLMAINIVTLHDYTGTHASDARQAFEDKNLLDEAKIITWASIITIFAVVFSSVIALVGLLKDSAPFLIPWMIAVLVTILFDCATIILSVVIMGFSNAFIIYLLIWIITTLLNTYCELCVLSQYQELKAGRGRHEDYPGSRPQGDTRRSQQVIQHVHVGESPITFGQSQHTVYEFHSQTMKEDGDNNSNLRLENGSKMALNGSAPVSNGKILELRPITSLPADMDTRYTGNYYTGSVEMRVVDTVPVMAEQRNTNPNSYITSLEGGRNGFAPQNRKIKRFRTVSESAVRQPLIDEASGHTSSSSVSRVSADVTTCNNHNNRKQTKDISLNLSSSSKIDQEKKPLTREDSEE